MLVDTHCHIHEPSYQFNPEEVIRRAYEQQVGNMICVGTNEQSSREAVAFAQNHDGIFSAAGVHPHDTKDGWGEIATILAASGKTKKLVAVGEIGLDYFYTHSPRDVQIKALEQQIDQALRYDLPIIFHVREAFEDFWPIFDNFHGIRGELHSFTDSQENLEGALKRGLYIGVNGISTFTKNDTQKAMYAAIPLEGMLLETDAPFLTPVPFRGKVNEPAFVAEVAKHHAQIRGISFEEIARLTTVNANALFALN